MQSFPGQGGLLELAKQLGISQACKIMGYTDSFYRFQELYEKGGELALAEITKRKPILRNRVEPATSRPWSSWRRAPALGQVRVANELKRRGLAISPAGVRCVWQRHDLETTKSLKALEDREAPGLALTEAQVAARSAPRTTRPMAIERMPRLPWRAGHVLCWHAQGRWQDLPADLHRYHSKVAFAKLYYRKTPITAADLLNYRVLPFFDEHDIKLCRMLTDRGTEYCVPRRHTIRTLSGGRGHRPQPHQSPQSADQRDLRRFHRTVLQEFYQVAFRKRIYGSIDQLQADLNSWVASYNEDRPHQGRWCFGKTPMQTFIDTTQLARDKMLNAA